MKGYYCCINKTCLNKFKALIKNKNKLIIEIISTETDTHDDFIHAEQQCSGKNRKMMGLQLQAEGVTNVQTKNIILNKTSAGIFGN